MSRHVVVGVAAGKLVHGALAFAAAQAAQRGLPLTLLHAFNPYPRIALAPPPELYGLRDVAREVAQAVLEEAAKVVRGLEPGVDAHTMMAETSTVRALVGQSADAALMVLGSHAGSSAWLGPVIGKVTVDARCPVVCVPEDAGGRPGPVVVAVDGAERTTAALAFAVQQAKQWQQPLVAVTAVGPGYDLSLIDETYLDELRRFGEGVLKGAVEPLRERHPDLKITEHVSVEDAYVALLAEGARAGLLVVGSHGRGALRRLALGSIGSSLIRAAACPVAVVRVQ